MSMRNVSGKKIAVLASTLLAVGVTAWAQAEPYKNDFQKAEVDSVPEEFLVLDGEFQVKAEGDNKFLELPGAPLETFGFLFGPTVKENATASGRFFGTSKGRRSPTFALGVNGVGGYKIRVAPAKSALELLKGDEVKETVPLKWQTGKWTHLEISVKSSGAEAKISGKVWQEGEKAPGEPTITWTDSGNLPSGRALVQASPYSGTPIRFDDLLVAAGK